MCSEQKYFSTFLTFCSTLFTWSLFQLYLDAVVGIIISIRMCEFKIVGSAKIMVDVCFILKLPFFQLYVMQIIRIFTVLRVALKTVSSTNTRYTVIRRVTHFRRCVAL